MLAGLSSTTRTVAMSGYRVAARHRPPNFADKAITVEVRLFHDRHHIAVETVAILRGDVFGGDHEDRYACRVRVFVQSRHDVEAVHLGHHQVEHDQIWNFPACGIDRLLTAVC